MKRKKGEDGEEFDVFEADAAGEYGDNEVDEESDLYEDDLEEEFEDEDFDEDFEEDADFEEEGEDFDGLVVDDE